MDTFTTLWNRLLLRAPEVGQFLAGDLIRDSFQQLAESRQWSWLQKSAGFFPPNYNVTDTISVTSNLPTVTASVGFFTPAMVGQQIRIGGNTSIYPTYTISVYISSTTVILDKPWLGPTLTGQSYNIFQCYFPVPSDFQSFYSLINPTVNMRLWTNVTQAELNAADAQRTTNGPSFCASFYDYTQNYEGLIGPVQPVYATGATPVSTTSYGYSYPVDSIFSLRITISGQPGGALTFTYQQDSQPVALPILVTDNNAIDLTNGAQVYFPQATYTAGDTFVFVARAGTTAAVPRYELWPRPINSQYVYPYLYNSKLPALSDDQPQLPLFVAQRGDVLLEMALAKAAQFPGTATRRNPYYDLALSDRLSARAFTLLNELALKDDDTSGRDLTYMGGVMAPTPWLDGSYLQSHAWPYATWGLT